MLLAIRIVFESKTIVGQCVVLHCLPGERVLEILSVSIATFSNALSPLLRLIPFLIPFLTGFSNSFVMYNQRRLSSDDRFGGDRFGDRGGRFGGDRFGSRRDDSNLMADSDTEVGADMANYTTIKNFYDPSKNPSNRSSEEIKHFMEKEQIAVSGTSDTFLPMMDFTDYAWPKQATNIFRRNNYERPTPIQAICWPISLSGRDLIGIAVSSNAFLADFLSTWVLFTWPPP